MEEQGQGCFLDWGVFSGLLVSDLFNACWYCKPGCRTLRRSTSAALSASIP